MVLIGFDVPDKLCFCGNMICLEHIGHYIIISLISFFPPLCIHLHILVEGFNVGFYWVDIFLGVGYILSKVKISRSGVNYLFLHHYF